MTRKDFEKVAAAIGEAAAHAVGDVRGQDSDPSRIDYRGDSEGDRLAMAAAHTWQMILEHIDEALAETNTRYDSRRFRDAVHAAYHEHYGH